MRRLIPLLAAPLMAGCLSITLPEGHYQREVFVRAAEQNPDLAHAHWSLGRRAMYAGEYRPAIRHFEAAVEAQPDLLEAHIAIGRCWLNLGRLRRARSPTPAQRP